MLRLLRIWLSARLTVREWSDERIADVLDQRTIWSLLVPERIYIAAWMKRGERAQREQARIIAALTDDESGPWAVAGNESEVA